MSTLTSRLKGILRALNEEATEHRKHGRDLEANALWRHHEALVEVYELALREEEGSQ